MDPSCRPPSALRYTEPYPLVTLDIPGRSKILLVDASEILAECVKRLRESSRSVTRKRHPRGLVWIVSSRRNFSAASTAIVVTGRCCEAVGDTSRSEDRKLARALLLLPALAATTGSSAQLRVASGFEFARVSSSSWQRNCYSNSTASYIGGLSVGWQFPWGLMGVKLFGTETWRGSRGTSDSGPSHSVQTLVSYVSITE